MLLFRDKLAELIQEKRSIICVSLDAALPVYRQKFTLPEHYMKHAVDVDEAIANFSMDIIDKVSDYVVLVKFNLWYLAQLERKSTIRHLVLYAKRRGLLTVLDCKINDIQDTLEIGLKAIANLGFDCITVNPLPGNLHYIVHKLREISTIAGREVYIGTLVLTVMSNREAARYFIEAQRENKELYKVIAEDVCNSDADGCIIGATFTTPEIAQTIRNIIGPRRIIFLVGIGVQGGSIDFVKNVLPGITIVNIGRSIIYSEDPREAARSIYERLRQYISNVICVI